MTLNEQFLQFDTAHAEVWELFVRFTEELIARGRRHGSADAVMHRIRWQAETGTEREPLKLNNNFSACYARKFHRQFPQRDGFFRLRVSAADPKPQPEQRPPQPATL